MPQLVDAKRLRKADHAIENIFLERWSPRAMSGELLPLEELQRLFEAARWAPSTYNEQEWRFLYAHRAGPHFQDFFGLLAEANQAWCDKAAVLMVVLSHKVFSRNGQPNPVHTFDAGLAVQNLLLQTASMGLVGHAMAGFDRNRARELLNVPDEYAVECMLAVGYPGNVEDLPEELREREHPSGRKAISEITFEGSFEN